MVGRGYVLDREICKGLSAEVTLKQRLSEARL